GDLLAADLYSPWAELKREELRTLYISLLRRTAEHLENRGSSRKAIEFHRLVIQIDPANEEAYRKLMLIYDTMGRSTDALRIYEECRKALEREVGVPPGTLTVSIYKRIIERR
ncbi:MAG: bacterial transcriptional activator domain-containing protein, partial [Desulfobacteraceae bacterium]|nr:bacterial transcriptional activator domain-containing protein [Desulfobacteraceae bacterium]